MFTDDMPRRNDVAWGPGIATNLEQLKSWEQCDFQLSVRIGITFE